MAEAAIYNQLGDPERAGAAIGMHGPGAPEDSIGHAEREAVVGLIRLQQGEVPAALATLREADSLPQTEGEPATTRAMLAMALAASGRPSEALDASATATQMTPG